MGPGCYPGRAVVTVDVRPLAPKVLIIEDDATVAEVLGRYLAEAGFSVGTEADGRAGLRRALDERPDLVVLDLLLPGLNGAEVCRRLRLAAPVPVIMVTALGEEIDRIRGLEIGADDYVTKPFSPREVTARAKAVLRRSREVASAAPPAVLQAGAIEVDVSTHQVRVGGRLVALTGKEFDLLAYLMRYPRRAFRREDLLEAVWGYREGDTSTVTVHVRWVRKKVEADPSRPRHLLTVWGVGYRFEP